MRYNNNKKHINTLAKTYTIVTKDMSLIVLDRVEDYVKYEILPPKILQKEYHRRVAIQNSSTIHKKNQALEESIRLLNQQLVWYNKDFVALEKERQRRLMKEKQEQSLRRESKAIHPSNDEMTGQGGDVMPVMAMMEAPLMTASAPRKKSSQKRAEPQKTIQLKTWESNAPYLKIIKAVSKKKQLKKYYDLQSEYIHSIPFYLDMGNFFYTQGKKEEALLILSNILELDFENAEYIRAFAFKLMELKLERIAVAFFERIQALRPFEAQASRDLALCYEAIGEYQKALNTHYSILTTPWDGRFSGSKIVTINELNQLISKHSLDISQINKRLIADMPVGMRIVINWSTDNSDMDLWVIDPNDEKTYYAHRESKIGGKISNDMTRGYGPEEFMIKKALRGKYQIKVKYFASSAQNIMGETVIRAEIFTDYASKRQKRKEIVFRVKEAKEVIDIGEIIY
ncbi:hypothetical protein MNB_SV-13-1898 [hydrothermal vent metagenome]|uniref:DUF2135 domain-containing protein n=1 Tax=hydrothermal vent metagenome TaxID=652676 RepID=A0A1W1D0Q4_9ZZZZ